MSLPLEDYAIIGDTHSVALVGRDGSIDWMCLPRFDSGACFAALLGGPEHGRWLLAPAGGHRATRRRYRDDTLVLETEFTTDDGAVRVIDAMPIRDRHPDLVRRVEGVRGRVELVCELVLRFDYGLIVPWLRREGHRTIAVAGPDSVFLDSGVPFEIGQDEVVTARFHIAAGETADFRLAWAPPRHSPSKGFDVAEAIERTADWWRQWANGCAYSGRHRPAVIRSLITLKALTYAPSGGIVAAPTTSLPERPGGVRNWDYRCSWIRDATFTLLALLDGGYEDAAAAWREWLLRAVAGRPEQMQIAYGVEGERRLPEVELDLPGYAGSRPVRVGNRASEQFQLDVYGELMDALYQARAHGLPLDENAWEVQRRLLDYLEGNWREPDNGIWEMRGRRRHFTHSKIMAWTAFDRAVKNVEEFGLDGPVDTWKRLRQDIFEDVIEHGYDSRRNTFTQYYGSDTLDAALLLIPNTGFLPATDPRMKGTVAAVQKHLCHDRLVYRYAASPDGAVDRLPSGEGAFLACSFWLADNLIMQGRLDEGRELFEWLVSLSNDVGLLSEEYDPADRRLVGNFPQALSHIALVTTAFTLQAGARSGYHRRARR